MQIVIETHQEGRESIWLGPERPQGPGFIMYVLCALGQVT